MEKPLVSIIIPTHRPKYFPKALYCALAQTYENKEIIVSDNSQTSEIEAISKAFSSVIYIKNQDGSPATNISQGIGIAKGDFVKYIFDDDLIFPNNIESLISLALNFGLDRIGIVTSYRQLIDESGQTVGTLRPVQVPQPSLIYGFEAIKMILKHTLNFIGEFSTVLINKRFLPVNQPIKIFELFGDTYTIGLIDVPLYISVLSRSDLAFAPYELSAFRTHEQGGSNSNVNPLLHHAVTDWLRLIASAVDNDLLSTEDLGDALQSYEKLSSQYRSIFPGELAKYDKFLHELRVLSGEKY